MILDDTHKSSELLKSNPEIKMLFDRTIEENRLILSRLTHELRNPLTLVRSTIQLIESNHPEVVDFKYWNTLISDIDDTVNLLNELSLYNHCNQVNLEEINLVEFISNCVHNLNPYASEKQISLTFTHDNSTSIYNTYSCDRIKMKQLITNIIKNAVEAAYDNSIIPVDLSLEPGSSNPYIKLTVTNSGNPIPSENLDHIFEPFVSFKPNGTGLGLSISQKIASLHKGSLSVSQTESTVTFTLLLPLDVTDANPFSL